MKYHLFRDTNAVPLIQRY